ncbi:cellulose synthase/poly-beta-1,6-N-acetylglucosamine synthase-like glycosyltransferase [Geodermatophilus tzadiensis]|uniref:Cellulose synthase/poly-beta-1,6-N-acetylglucosamine synthase-like glycosyltransferase n=1 Tax=Geodermatophilus tzadiensis TaxID=1137988 RepID=A0A2T0TFJ3_9ACTN|nr:glycosyltransferase family 2 protein [Geodermatophilus tzadiensis]PRY44388.1 cellulose synthase/poly-beta-1,6-N-acetylglucosamine synthase-like glycosyltransferase [Geodermatophilus tzadiensis]
MREALTGFVTTLNWTVLGYVLVLDTSMLLLVLFGARRVVTNLRWSGAEGLDRVFASPLTPGVSVLVPAHDEEAGVLDTLAAVLSQRYPLLEVVLVDDGSTDRTFALVAERYGLTPVTPRWTADTVVEGRVLSVHRATTGDPLTVVRKTSVKRRSDALNVALNLARHPLVCMVDADSLLEPDALLKVARPFIEDPEHVVGSGGVIRTANAALTDRGAVLEPRLSRRWLVRIQAVEYLRSFLLGRTTWADADALLIISGAFGLFRRDAVVEVGGLDPRSLAEDAELVVTLQEHLRRAGRPSRMVFVPETVCWTEVPETWSVLGRQRQRWSHGLAQLLWKHRRMVGNPRFGPVGLLALPFFLLFELLGPVVEVLGLVSVVVAAVLGLLDPGTAALMVAVALALGVLVSTAVVAVEEFTFHRYRSGADLRALLLAGAVENVGYRQLHAWFRLRGLLAALTRRDPVWTAMPRTGFTTAVAPAEA